MNYIVLDIETQRLVEDWSKPWEAGLACCCVWWNSVCRIYGPGDDEMESLSRLLTQTKDCLLVTWNGLAFDIPLLEGLGVKVPHDSCDPAAMMRELTGRRCRLEEVARATLGKGKSGHGENAPQLWKEGRLAALHAYCIQDVEITRELFLFAQRYGYLVVENRVVPVRVPGCTAGPREVCEPPSKEPATEKQLAYIRRLYYPTHWAPTPGFTKHQAAQMIERLKNTSGQVRP